MEIRGQLAQRAHEMERQGYEIISLNGQRALLARTSEGIPYFALIVYAREGTANLLYVIAGRKLNNII